MLVLCDFDGTITEMDVTDLIWDSRVPSDERTRMNEAVLAGRLTMHEFISQGYSFVEEPPHELLEQLRERVRIRAGFGALYHHLARRGTPFHVVSNGLDFYMREFLPSDARLTCFAARFDGRYHVELPPGVVLEGREEFKVNRVRSLKGTHPGPTVFIGDGRADFAPARLCDRVFAVEESRLAQLCRDAGVSAVEFRSFETILEQLG